MADGTKKEYRLMAGRPILAHTIQAFVSTGRFSDILITVPTGHIERARAMLAPHLDTDQILVAEGGSTRQESVYNGLLALAHRTPGVVLIHDGARPWVDGQTIERVMEGALRWGACLPVVPSADAVKEIDDQGLVLRHMDRSRTVCTQTPQGFDYRRILAAHRKAAQAGRHGFIDDGEVYSAYEGAVYTVRGGSANRKITFMHDLVPREEKA